MQTPKFYWQGFIVVLVAYSIIYLTDYSSVLILPHNPVLAKQITRWFAIALVYGSGIFVLRKTKVIWLSSLWHLIHLALFGYLLMIGFYELLIAPVPYAIRASVAPIVEFLISPFLYLLMGVLHHTLIISQSNDETSLN